MGCEWGEAYLRRCLVAEVSSPPCRSPALHGIIVCGSARIAIDRISATAGGASASWARAARSPATCGGAAVAIEVIGAILVEGTGRGRRQ